MELSALTSLPCDETNSQRGRIKSVIRGGSRCYGFGRRNENGTKNLERDKARFKCRKYKPYRGPSARTNQGEYPVMVEVLCQTSPVGRPQNSSDVYRCAATRVSGIGCGDVRAGRYG